MGLNKNAFHNDSLQMFQEKVFEGILTEENIVGKKTTIKVNDEKYYGFFLEKGRHTYFIQDFEDHKKSVLDILPIQVVDKVETDYNKKVFFFITRYNSVKIPETKKLSFKQLIDSIANFEHTNPEHWLLYKIMVVSAWIDRVNYRVIAERGFGKDSVINNVKDLVGSTANIYGATYPKLEYSLKNKLLIFNEMGNLKQEDKHNMQQFLLAIGAFFNKYQKKSRATETTLEEYDISKQSLGIIYNPPMYYIEKGQEFFDTMFTSAVQNRFIPFYLEGRLDEKFDAQFDVPKVVEQNMQLYKDVISTLRYYRANNLTHEKPIPVIVQFDDNTRRFERSFLKICDYLWEYCEYDERDYMPLAQSLYESYLRYDEVLKESLMRIK